MVGFPRMVCRSTGQMYAIFPIPASGKKAGPEADGRIPGMPWELVGHEWAVDLLRRDLTANRLAHAYLFTGADGIGKRTLAVQFARAVNCEAPPEPGDLCGQCRACRLIGAGKHPDLFHLQPEGTGARILVDSTREVIQSTILKPIEAKRRIALLTDFHRALPNAANALLKTIEEPPPSVLLLITAESADELLPTIVSRCRVVPLRPLREQTVAQALRERWHTDPERAALLARLSGGRLGWAVLQTHLEDWAAEREAQFQQWSQIFRANRFTRFALAQKTVGERSDLRDSLHAWQSFAHDLLLRTLSGSTEVANIDFQAAVDSLAGGVSPEQARTWLYALRRVEEQIDRNANLRLALEAAFLDAPGG
jgi:DNA polymerase-3 subunit delta'